MRHPCIVGENGWYGSTRSQERDVSPCVGVFRLILRTLIFRVDMNTVRVCVDVVPSRTIEGLRKIEVVFMSPCGFGVVVDVLTMSVRHQGQLSEYGASQENQCDTESKHDLRRTGGQFSRS